MRQLELLTPQREPVGYRRYEGHRHPRAVYDWAHSSDLDAEAAIVDDGGKTTAGPAGPRPELSGEWTLIYASNGTVVTRTPPAQLLSMLGNLGGIGIQEITQSLEVLEGQALVRSDNTAILGLGPLGSWKARRTGTPAVEALLGATAHRPRSATSPSCAGRGFGRMAAPRRRCIRRGLL